METKLAARAAVHAAFAREGRYYPTNDTSGEGVAVSIRVHGTQVETGDLDREGYSQIVEDIETIVFLKTEVDANGVKSRGYVKMSDTSHVYRLDLREPAFDLYTVTFQVARQGQGNAD